MSLNSAQAASTGDVLINEIAWMGTKDSANDEWIELHNTTPQAIDLNGWILKAVDGTPTIKLAGSDPANWFYLLERSKDYTGALNNKGEELELFDNKDNLIDLVDASSGWPEGDHSTKQTMERKNATTWQTSQNPGGTPKAENSSPLAAKPRETLPHELAAVSELVPKTTTYFYPIFIAFALAVFSGIIILVLKNKVKIG